MGQAASQAQDGLLALVEGPGRCRCNCQERRQADEYNDYLNQFTGSAAPYPHASGSSELALSLEERRAEGCCNLPFAGHDDELADPNLNEPFKTDVCSLASLYHDGNSIECAEVCRAVCVTAAAHEDARQATVREGPCYIVVDSGLADGEVLPTEPPRPLRVPPEFRGLEYDWSAPSQCQVQPSSRQHAKLQSCLKHFVRAMLTGVVLQLRLDPHEVARTPHGQNIGATVALTQDLSLLLLSAAGVERSVPVSSIRWVRPPEKDGGTSWFLPDERDSMVVMRLAGGRFVRLQLQGRERASYFGTCMRLLVKAARLPEPPDGGPDRGLASSGELRPVGPHPRLGQIDLQGYSA